MNLDELIEKAKSGDERACFRLGMYYHKSGDNNIEKSIYWLEKSSDNNLKAKLFLGAIYHKGLGIPVDEEKGIKLIEFAAKNGEIKAVRILGQIAKENGDIKKYLMYFHKAANKGDAVACFILGGIYQDGTGVEKDEEMAREYIFQAAQLKYKPAIKKHRELLDELYLNFKFKDIEQRISKMPKQYPSPCFIALINKNDRKLNAHGELENEEYVCGNKIIKKIELSEAETQGVISAIENTEQYSLGGNVGTVFTVAFMFGEGGNQVKVLVDYEQHWVQIKQGYYFLAFGSYLFESKDNLSLLVLTKNLANKYLKDYFYLLKE